MMTTLNELNECVLEMDGTATELNEFHLSALKAAVAITTNKPCTDEMLLELVATKTSDFGACEKSVEYGGTCLDLSLDDYVMLIEQYELYVGKTGDNWHTDSVASYFITGKDARVKNKCKFISLFDCISNLSSEVLDI